MTDFDAQKTLLQAVPALASFRSPDGGTVKLVPQGPDLPTFTLVEGRNTLGRDPQQCGCTIDSPQVSRVHCEVLLEQGKLWIKDLGSQNGLYVNGKRASQARLQPGDRIGLSPVLSYLVAVDEPLGLPLGRAVELGEPTLDGPDAPPPAGVDLPRARSGALELSEGQSTDVDWLLRQRDIFATLYQVSLSCLEAPDRDQVEVLLTRVVQRLVPLQTGFILYRADGAWRATICPRSEPRPSTALLRACFQLISADPRPRLLRTPEQLLSLGLHEGSALLVSLVAEGRVLGLLAAISSVAAEHDAEMLETLRQLGLVATAALRLRPDDGAPAAQPS